MDLYLGNVVNISILKRYPFLLYINLNTTTPFGVGVMGITDQNNVGASRVELGTYSQVNILLAEEEGKVEPDISNTFSFHKFFTK